MITHAWSFTLPGHPPGPNQTRGSWHKGWKIAQQWKNASTFQARQYAPAYPPSYARVTITLVYSRKPMKDIDNAYSSVKYILDGLVDGGLILDDGPGHIELLVQQVLEKDSSRETRVSVEEITKEQMLGLV